MHCMSWFGFQCLLCSGRSSQQCPSQGPERSTSIDYHLNNIQTHINSRSCLLPPNAFDTHVHVFDPRLGPYAASRAYTPEDAPLERLIAFSKSISADTAMARMVLVQPSPYKTDCTVLMRCLQELQRRGNVAYAMVVIDVDQVENYELEDMHSLGVRGIRLNFQADGKEPNVSSLVGTLQKAARRICHLPGWMIQLFVPAWAWDGK